MVWPISCDKWKAPLVNPISAKSDQHEYSPNYINTLPREKVMRINKMITVTMEEFFDLLWSSLN